MKLSLYYPVSPIHVNQAFGANYDYYHAQFGTNGHMGVDFMSSHGEPVYAPMDGTATYITDNHGGEGIYLVSDQPLEYPDGTCWFRVILWHLVGDTDPKFPKPFLAPTKVNAGDLLGYADNTGAPFESSGDHLHMGLQPINSTGGLLLPDNGINGCIDPMPYFNGQYSVNILIGLYKQVLDLAQKVWIAMLHKK